MPKSWRYSRNVRFINTPGEPAGGGTPPAAPADPATPTEGDDKPLGPNGEKALKAEREARGKLEQTVAQMQQSQKDQMAAIASAFGVKPDAQDDGTQLLTALQQQVAEMQREALVLRIAAQHKLAGDDDIEFLKSAKDEEAMGKLAARLAANNADPTTPSSPKPDLTQGGKAGDAPKADVKPGIARLRQAYSEPDTND